jgi:hypothetical protein
MIRRLRDRLRGERGEAAMLSGVLLVAGVLVPLIFLIALFARVESAQLAAQQAAHTAVRSAVQAPDPAAASNAANTAVARERAGSGVPLNLDLAGVYARGQVMSANVSASVPIGNLPLLGSFGTITVHATARAPVGRYRSILEEPASQGGSP